ncbi:unnamed protein product [Closterium sp. Naga37s-1]|nr:unnamed protein product [Closterium sp. Naga37s-1]
MAAVSPPHSSAKAPSSQTSRDLTAKPRRPSSPRNGGSSSSDSAPPRLTIFDGKQIRRRMHDDAAFTAFLSHEFDRLDADGNGALSLGELKPALLRLGELLGMPPAGTAREVDELVEGLFASFMSPDLTEEIGRDSFVRLPLILPPFPSFFPPPPHSFPLPLILSPSPSFFPPPPHSFPPPPLPLVPSPIPLSDPQEDPLSTLVYDGGALRRILGSAEEAEALISALFAELDTDGSGCISKSELRPALVRLGLHGGDSTTAEAREHQEQVLERIIDRYCLDGDGELCRDEFSALLLDVFKDLSSELEAAPLYLPQRATVLNGAYIKKILNDDEFFTAVSDSMFEEWDVSHKGYLVCTDAIAGFRKLGLAYGLPPPDAAEADKVYTSLFLSADVNLDGFVDKGEFRTLLRSLFIGMQLQLEETPLVLESSVEPKGESRSGGTESVFDGPKLLALLREEGGGQRVRRFLEEKFQEMDKGGRGRVPREAVRAVVAHVEQTSVLPSPRRTSFQAPQKRAEQTSGLPSPRRTFSAGSPGVGGRLRVGGRRGERESQALLESARRRGNIAPAGIAAGIAAGNAVGDAGSGDWESAEQEVACEEFVDAMMRVLQRMGDAVYGACGFKGMDECMVRAGSRGWTSAWCVRVQGDGRVHGACGFKGMDECMVRAGSRGWTSAWCVRVQGDGRVHGACGFKGMDECMVRAGSRGWTSAWCVRVQGDGRVHGACGFKGMDECMVRAGSRGWTSAWCVRVQGDGRVHGACGFKGMDECMVRAGSRGWTSAWCVRVQGDGRVHGACGFKGMDECMVRAGSRGWTSVWCVRVQGDGRVHGACGFKGMDECMVRAGSRGWTSAWCVRVQGDGRVHGACVHGACGFKGMDECMVRAGSRGWTSAWCVRVQGDGRVYGACGFKGMDECMVRAGSRGWTSAWCVRVQGDGRVHGACGFKGMDECMVRAGSRGWTSVWCVRVQGDGRVHGACGFKGMDECMVRAGSRGWTSVWCVRVQFKGMDECMVRAGSRGWTSVWCVRVQGDGRVHGACGFKGMDECMVRAGSRGWTSVWCVRVQGDGRVHGACGFKGMDECMVRAGSRGWTSAWCVRVQGDGRVHGACGFKGMDECMVRAGSRGWTSAWCVRVQGDGRVYGACGFKGMDECMVRAGSRGWTSAWCVRVQGDGRVYGACGFNSRGWTSVWCVRVQGDGRVYGACGFKGMDECMVRAGSRGWTSVWCVRVQGDGRVYGACGFKGMDECMVRAGSRGWTSVWCVRVQGDGRVYGACGFKGMDECMARAGSRGWTSVWCVRVQGDGRVYGACGFKGMDECMVRAGSRGWTSVWCVRVQGDGRVYGACGFKGMDECMVRAGSRGWTSSPIPWQHFLADFCCGVPFTSPATPSRVPHPPPPLPVCLIPCHPFPCASSPATPSRVPHSPPPLPVCLIPRHPFPCASSPATPSRVPHSPPPLPVCLIPRHPFPCASFSATPPPLPPIPRTPDDPILQFMADGAKMQRLMEEEGEVAGGRVDGWVAVLHVCSFPACPVSLPCPFACTPDDPILQFMADGAKMQRLMEEEGELATLIDILFSSLDTDGSGTISSCELKPALSTMVQNMGLHTLCRECHLSVYVRISGGFTGRPPPLCLPPHPSPPRITPPLSISLVLSILGRERVNREGGGTAGDDARQGPSGPFPFHCTPLHHTSPLLLCLLFSFRGAGSASTESVVAQLVMTHGKGRLDLSRDQFTAFMRVRAAVWRGGEEGWGLYVGGLVWGRLGPLDLSRDQFTSFMRVRAAVWRGVGLYVGGLHLFPPSSIAVPLSHSLHPLDPPPSHPLQATGRKTGSQASQAGD